MRQSKFLKIKNHNPDVKIIEKKLGIPGDYQFKAIQSNNFFQSNWHKNKLQVVDSLITYNSKMTILDLGTGSGNFEIKNHKKVKQIIGIDYNNLALEFLSQQLESRKIKNVSLIQSDIKKVHLLKLPKCDVIILIDVIEHLKMNDVGKLILKLKKLLKTKGYIVVITPNYNSPWSLMEYLFDHALTSLLPKFGECQHLSKFNSNNLRQVFASNGLADSKILTFNLFSWLIPGRYNILALKLELMLNLYWGNLVAGTFRE